MRTALHRPLCIVLCLLAASSVIAGPASIDDASAISNWASPPYWMPPAERARGLESKHPLAFFTGALAFHAVPPCRIVDTRGFGFTGAYGPPHLTAGAVRSFAVTSPGTSCGIPSGVIAVSFNFAVTTLSANGNLVVYPTSFPQPTVSSLNWTPSEVAISDAAVIGLGSDSINVVVNGPAGSTVDLIVDVNGYYAADPVVTTVNGSSGAITLSGSPDIGVDPTGPTISIVVNAPSANSPNTIVRRDASGNFAAGKVTVTDLDLGASGRILRGASTFFHSPGTTNTYAGVDAGNPATAGSENTAFGKSALASVVNGNQNTAVGYAAGAGINGGENNVAVGYNALSALAGDDNTAVGHFACGNCTGLNNVALGSGTLLNATGSGNIAIGTGAGGSVTNGTGNIYIGHSGAVESNTIRIGTSGIQSATRIAGINGSTSAGGIAVLVNGLGQLGTTTSSVRFKEDVRDVGAESDGLMQLRPVAFRYKPELDPEGIEQFGLIAEEVEQVYPGLVTCGEDGQPQAVRYHFLVPMLLNEVQKDRKELADLKARLERLESLLAENGNR